MKLSFCTNVYPIDRIPAACAMLKELGYDGVELWHQYIVSRPIERIREEILALGLEIVQLCPYFNLTGTKEQLAASYTLAQDYIGYAEALDCRLIRVFTGEVSAADATPEQFAQGVRGLRTICQMEPKLTFVLEMHRGSLMESVNGTLRLLEAVDCDNLRVNLQLPLLDPTTDVYRCAEALGAYTVHLHAHNWIGRPEEYHFVCLGDGVYDFPRFLSILREHGFGGAVSIEHADHLGRDNPDEVAAKEAAYLKALFRELDAGKSDVSR